MGPAGLRPPCGLAIGSALCLFLSSCGCNWGPVCFEVNGNDLTCTEETGRANKQAINPMVRNDGPAVDRSENLNTRREGEKATLASRGLSVFTDTSPRTKPPREHRTLYSLRAMSTQFSIPVSTARVFGQTAADTVLLIALASD